MNLTANAKLIIIVIVGLFIFKMGFGFLAKKFPNTLTNAANTVVQTA
jgi:hypothetical protein